MRLGMKWNRRSFLGTCGMIAGSMMASKKLFAAKGSAKVSGFGQWAIPTTSWESRRLSIARGR